MKVLMFGWEFPPHISGGLGTACYGLTKGLSKLKDIEVIFVVPKSFGDEDPNNMELIGASEISIRRNKKFIKANKAIAEYLEVKSNIVPYTDPEDYLEKKSKAEEENSTLMEIDEDGKIPFTGGYGPNLLHDIHNYSLVARAIAEDNEFDLIHAHDWLCYPAGVAAKEATGKPLVVHVHATDFDRSGGSVNPSVYNIERYGMEKADKIIAVSNLTRQTVIEKYGINPDKVTTVYNAVEPVSNDVKQTFKKGVDEKIVTFLGRITMQKGPEYFVQAAHKVLQKMDNVRFVMAGSGDKMEKMIRYAAQLKIADKFHFTGFLRGDDVTNMLRLSDIYIMPSVSEPFGISPLEAMQTDVPVIISKQSGVSEILKHAIKVDFWDVDATADAIFGILNSKSMTSMFKKHGRKEVDSIKWENSARNVRAVYEETLKDAKAEI